MNKTIYDEALEKIDVELDAWDRAEHFELLELVEQALEKAQKQEKLLELYKELVNLHNQYLNEKNKMKKLEIIRKTSNVEEEIKELENE